MYKHLTSEQRYAIYLGLQKGDSEKMIAELIKVDKSTVSREKRRNSTANGKYVWVKAQAKADGRKRRTPGNRRINDTLRWRVTELIKNEQWSPRQISGRLLRDGIHISHETIYGIIRSDESGVLASCCRHRMKYRHKARHTHETKVKNIPNRVSIHERPAEADGKRFGDWEMDTIVDSKGHAILTLT